MKNFLFFMYIVLILEKVEKVKIHDVIQIQPSKQCCFIEHYNLENNYNELYI